MSKLKISVSVCDVAHLNTGRKRKIHLESRKENQRKFLRNCGLEYTGTNGTNHEEKPITDGVKKCNGRCNKPGCILTPMEKIGICQDFWRIHSDNYVRQSNILLSLMEWSTPAVRTVNIDESRRNATFKYHLRRDNGMKFVCCLRTFLDTLQITNNRVALIRKKMLRGETYIEDGRGLHENRPMKHNQDTKDLINGHIQSFPTYLTHYSRNAGDPNRQYLQPELNASKMFRLFTEMYGDGLSHLEHLYKDIFRETKLRFGLPKSDTCGICDRLYQRLCNLDPNLLNEIEATQQQLNQHHEIADNGYAAMKADIAQGKLDNTYIVLCVDLQKILLSPRLSHKEMYYKRKFTSFNLAITSPCSDDFTMFFWSENEGNRGQDDIGTAIFNYVRTHFTILEAGVNRVLSVWSDRCFGQNTNYSTVCLYKYLVHLGYFSEVNQKFLISGHTFLSCDRHFAMIERAQKNAVIHTPQDWINVIRQARLYKPFHVVPMNFQEFRNISSLKPLIPKPTDFRVSLYHWIQITRLHPSIIRTKTNHTSEWVSHTVYAPWNRGTRVRNREEWGHMCLQNFEFAQLYPDELHLSPEKLADIRTMIEYLPISKQAFFTRFL